jgi:polyphosphate kinase 2 (PPK2 family)
MLPERSRARLVPGKGVLLSVHEDQGVASGGRDHPHPATMKRDQNERTMLELQVELVRTQRWVKRTGHIVSAAQPGPR